MKKDVIMAMTVTFCLTVTSFAAILSRSETTSGLEYNPWYDTNDDGKIDITDIATSIANYGTLGDPTKNVNVTNWPTQQVTFSKNLLLRAAKYMASNTMMWELVDEDTPYPDPSTPAGQSSIRADYESVPSIWLTTFPMPIYNRTFIHEKPSIRSYTIVGMPKVSLVFNITNGPPAQFAIEFYAKLGAVNSTGDWRELADMGVMTYPFNGAFQDSRRAACLFAQVTSPITVNAYERLAIQIAVVGFTYTGTTNLTWWKLLFNMNTDEFLVSIPIVEG